MKTVIRCFIIIACCSILSSCATTKLVKQYDATYTYKVYNNINYRFYYTNSYQMTCEAITFIDHNNEATSISSGAYYIETLK